MPNFTHFLAQKLGMTVGRLQWEMPNPEFIRWKTYYGRLAQRAELEALKAQARGR